MLYSNACWLRGGATPNFTVAAYSYSTAPAPAQYNACIIQCLAPHRLLRESPPVVKAALAPEPHPLGAVFPTAEWSMAGRDIICKKRAMASIL
jgi:hypothetical protein